MLEEYFNNYNTNSYLIFILNSGSVDSKKKLYKLINDNGTINKLSVTEEYLDTFVRNYIKDNGFTMNNMDIKFFWVDVIKILIILRMNLINLCYIN